MKVVVVSGIWPPDVGGPAVHAPALARFLAERGHAVEVVTTAEREPAAERFPITWVARSGPAPLRHATVARRVSAAARTADVVYATSMVRRAAAGALAARRPLVVKLVADEAYERARRSGAFAGSLEAFQEWDGTAAVQALRATRTGALRRAAHVFVPSAYLREIALGWGLDPGRVTVLPNPAPRVPELPARALLRAELGLDARPALGFAGRLTVQKALPDLLAALVEVPGVALLLLGDGPERDALEDLTGTLGLRDRVRFLGGGDRDAVLRLFRAVDAAVLSSAWENFPHTVVEALAVGTPVVATAVGGVPEVVVDGGNGLLVPAGDVAALASALRAVTGDEALRAGLAAAAAPSVERLAEERLLTTVEETLVETVREASR